MEYVITNDNRKVYIKLNEVGQPVTCVKSMAQRFPEQKAKNILRCLPRTMRKFHFVVVPTPNETDINNVKTEEMISTKYEIKSITEKKIIKSHNYIVPHQVTDWMQRVESCNQLIIDAAERRSDLCDRLSNIDKELSNCLHEIELTSSKNACDGYKEYKKIKDMLTRRRVIKDELAIVTSISQCNIAFDHLENFDDKLKNRTFTIREI